MKPRNGTLKLLFVTLLLFGLSGLAHADNFVPIPPIISLADATASAVAWSPDGTELAVGDADGISVYTGALQLIRRMPEPSDQMKTLAWSPNGLYLAAGIGNNLGTDLEAFHKNDVDVWNAQTGELITQFKQHEEPVPSLAWSPDSTEIATGSWDRTIRIWNALTGQVQYVLNAPTVDGYTYEVMSMDWGSNGQIAAVIGDIGLYVWSTFDQPPKTLINSAGRQPPEASPGYAKWSPNNQFIGLGGSAFYDAQNQREVYPTRRQPAGLGVDWRPDGRLLAFFAFTQNVLVCDPFSDTIVATLQGNLGHFDQNFLYGYQDSLDWSPDGKLLAGAAGDGYVRIWMYLI